MHATNLDSGPATSLLRAGDTCWKANSATRATLLVDGEQYFCALRTALLQARKQILIAGWDLDSRTVLPRVAGEADDSVPEELGELLGFIRRTRRGIEIRVVRWDYHWFYSDDREPGKPYIPVHDTQLCVAGPIARDMADYLHETWPATAPRPERIEAASPLWPQALRVDFHDVRIGISRTLPATPRRVPMREIEAFYLAAIAQTSSSLYVENQYFTSTRIAAGIAEQFRRNPALQGLLVGMDRPKTQAELHIMGYGRSGFCKILADAGVLARVPMVAAFSSDVGINLHSKLAVFDDRWLTVGSANLNRRSMGFDVECNLILEASTLAHRRQIRQVRNRLLAEHLGMSAHEVEDALGTHGARSSRCRTAFSPPGPSRSATEHGGPGTDSRADFRSRSSVAHPATRSKALIRTA